MGFVGFIIVKRAGCFIRWLLLGAKGSFDDFYTYHNIVIVDYLIGISIFFAVMYLIVIVF